MVRDVIVVSGFYTDWRQLLGVLYDREMAEIAGRHYALDALERIADAIREGLDTPATAGGRFEVCPYCAEVIYGR